MKAALVVQNCIAGNLKKNMASTRHFILDASKKGSQIIVFPEMNLTGYISGPDIFNIAAPLDKGIIKCFSGMAQALNITILVGLAEKTPRQKIYASQIIFHAEGGIDIYRKIHLAPLEKKNFSPGNDITIFNSQEFKFGVQLCYDAHFPELSLAMALKQADIIFIPHASPRGSSENKYESWIRHLRARAFDNGLYIAACNQTGDNTMGLCFPGICLFIGPDGNVLYRAINKKEGIHIVQIKRDILDQVRSHKMKYFLPHRRPDLFKI